MMGRTIFDGVECHYETGSGSVSWLSDWCRADALVAAGFLRREHYGPATYGHVSYYVTARGAEYAAAPGRGVPCWCGRSDGTPHSDGAIGHGQ